ncbi:hypothetical protein RB195_020587 [Necator americanus]|uniref:FYVE-type domain-containing protein n=1 Tax=Necator americanus TaxID=51031 RepID=A0ABR1CN09_NECAM
METVPDMDALLDELEEVVVGNKPTHSKISKSCVEQTVVIELPLHLRKLSDKEAIKIDLKPPDPSIVEAEICTTVTAESFTEKTARTMQNGNNSEGYGNMQHAIPTQASSNDHRSIESMQSYAVEEEKKEVESERDTEFEEVLKYLEQFEEKNNTVLDDGTTTALEIDMEVKDAHNSVSCSHSSEKRKGAAVEVEANISVDSTQKDDDSYGSSFDREDQQLEAEDDNSLRTAAEAVAEALLDAVANSVEKSVDKSFSCGNKLEDKEERGRASSVGTISSFDDKATVCDEKLAGEYNSQPATVTEDSTGEESVLETVSDSTDTVLTVIHNPNVSAMEKERSDIDGVPKQADEREVQRAEEIAVVEQTDSGTSEVQGDTITAIENMSPKIEPEDSTESSECKEEQITTLSTSKEPTEEKTRELVSPTPKEKTEVERKEQDTTAVKIKEEDRTEDDTGSVVGEARSEQTQSDEMKSSSERLEMKADGDDELGLPGDVERERGSSEESSHGLETAIECETSGEDLPSPVPPSDRFGAQVIATIHDLSQESDPMRLTESELQLGKSKPYWIPDDDCSMCMLCNTRFSLLNRRHHCRACGRVVCGSCCKERATLQYMKDEPKKQTPARVCAPCASMLARIEEYEKMMREHAEGGTVDNPTPSTSSGTRVARGVLKTRAESEPEPSQSTEGQEKKRSVVFRDGVKPGATSPSNTGDPAMEEKSTTVKPKKKSRKRHAVARRVAELRLEDELGCALPTPSRPQLLVICPNGEINMEDEGWVKARLKEELPVTIVLKKNLSCVVKICSVGSMSVFCVHSCGFATIGLDEVLFAWKRDDLEDFALPLNVLHRIAQIYSSSCDEDQAGVRQVCTRLPAIHSVPIALPPLSRHILFFPPTLQNFSSLPVPNSPFLVALFLSDAELPWAMACPNRLLLRLGLKESWYPAPIVNIVGRNAVFTTETSQTVLKVFTDFRSWSFRMKHLVGSTVTLSNDVTSVEIPRSAKQDLDDIISWNRTMIAWTTDVNLSADSHLVCEETEGLYATQVLARGTSRNATGTSFIIIDGGLKTSGLQISVVEDGVAIRVSSDKLESLLTALSSMEEWTTTGASGSQFTIRWTDTCPRSSSHGPISPIDGLNLADKYQYGLSLERAISSVLQVPSVSDYGVRLSHVYNLKDGRLSPDDEPKVFSIAEMLARECTGMLEPYLTMLINMNIMSISIRVGVSTERVEYDVSPWCGMEDEQMKYKQNMDQLIPVLYEILVFTVCLKMFSKVLSRFILKS